MNDFTKEELIKILDALDYRCATCGITLSQLIIKIQSMIDNYCEHENEYTDSNYFTGCMDCGRKW